MSDRVERKVDAEGNVTLKVPDGYIPEGYKKHMNYFDCQHLEERAIAGEKVDEIVIRGIDHNGNEVIL